MKRSTDEGRKPRKIETIDLSLENSKANYKHRNPLKSLDRLQQSVIGSSSAPIFSRNKAKGVSSPQTQMCPASNLENPSDHSSEFGGERIEDLPPFTYDVEGPRGSDARRPHAAYLDDGQGFSGLSDVAEANFHISNELLALEEPSEVLQSPSVQDENVGARPYVPRISTERSTAAGTVPFERLPGPSIGTTRPLKRANSPQSSFPSAKKQRSSSNKQKDATSLTIEGSTENVQAKSNIDQIFEDMEGIDPDLLADLRDCIDLVD